MGQRIFLHTPPKTTPFRFLVQGGLHGDEKLAQEFVEWLLAKYRNGSSLLNQFNPNEVSVDFIPRLNPDGIKFRQRNNFANVNLNRNFDILWGMSKENPGKKSFSEPETQALKKLFEKNKYIAAVDVHGYINWLVTPSSPAMVEKQSKKKLSSKKTSRYNQWISVIGKETSKTLPKYQLKTAGELGDGGAFEDWAFWSQDTFALCLELESTNRFKRKLAGDSMNKHSKTLVGINSGDYFAKYELFIYNVFRQALNLTDKTSEINTVQVFKKQ